MEKDGDTMNYRDELLKKIKHYQSEHDRLASWILGLDADGFDWENVTDVQKWAIEHNSTTEVTG